MMRRLLQFAALFLLAVVPARATWTEKQNVNVTTCSSTANTCAIAVTPTTANSAGIIIGITGSNTSGAISSISPGTWVIPASSACVQSDSNVGGAASCAYCLVVPTGTTSFTVTWNTSSVGSYTSAGFVEATTTLTAAFDVAGKRDQSTAAANINGVTLTLGGANDFIVQSGEFAGIASDCKSPYNVNPVFNAYGNPQCYAINQSSGTPPSALYTNSSSRAALVAIALKETSSSFVPESSAFVPGL